jgi:hypothetical protein
MIVHRSHIYIDSGWWDRFIYRSGDADEILSDYEIIFTNSDKISDVARLAGCTVIVGYPYPIITYPVISTLFSLSINDKECQEVFARATYEKWRKQIIEVIQPLLPQPIAEEIRDHI